jgi:hypothetical protein
MLWSMPSQTQQCKGQDFEDLDLLVKPLAPPKTPVQPTIEVLISPRLQAMRMIYLRNGGKSCRVSRENTIRMSLTGIILQRLRMAG